MANADDWQWRVYIQHQATGGWLLVPHCVDVREPNCEIYCALVSLSTAPCAGLEDGAAYDVRRMASRKQL